MNKKNQVSLPVGGSSILTIFAVLCLLTFSLLTLSTAKANKKLSDKAVDAISDYYRADTEAEEILGCIRKGEIPKQVVVNQNSYTYECKISDTRKLCVKVIVEGDDYHILQWKEVSTTKWESEDSLEVWGGETIE
ncbi:MAG: hypothetical protein RSB37_07205 [Acetivibrio sp.]